MTGYQARVLEVASHLAKARAEVERLEAEFAALVPSGPGSVGAVAAVMADVSGVPGASAEPSLTNRIIAAVVSAPNGVNAETVVQLTGGSLSTVRSVLARLVAKGRLKKVGKSHYGRLD